MGAGRVWWSHTEATGTRGSGGRERCCVLLPGRAWHLLHLGLKEEDGNCSLTVITALCFKARHWVVER